MYDHHSTIAVLSEAVFRTLGRYQVGADDLFEQAGIELSDDSLSMSSIETAKVTNFWRSATQLTRNPAIGFEVGANFYPTNLHILGFAWLASLTLERAFRRFHRYYSVYTASYDVEVRESDEALSLVVSMRPDTAEEARDCTMAMLMSLCHSITPDGFAPREVCFQGNTQVSGTRLRSHFGCPVETGADENLLTVSLAQAQEPLPRGNFTMAHASDTLVEQYIRDVHASEFDVRARAIISCLLPEGGASKENVASELAVSPRTLTRRLAERGVSYRELLDEVRRELATGFMTDPNKSTTDIAYLVGLNDSSNFARAFRRWTGQSPSEYRSALGVR